MTVPDELVQAVHDALGINIEAHEDSTLVMTLAAVPDGWAKIGGQWVQVTKGPMSSHGQLLLVKADVEQEQ